jgi:DNA-directed RNA polymerase subunit K/omega
MSKRQNDNGLSSNDATSKIGNMFTMILAASNRVREIRRGKPSLINSKNGDLVHAMMEIERGIIGREYAIKTPPEENRHRSHHRSYK